MTIALPLAPVSPAPVAPPAPWPAASRRALGRDSFARTGAKNADLVGVNSSRPTVPELQDLVRRAQANDPEAWETLYRVTYAGLLAYARRRLWGQAEADDAVSETFARACNRIVDFEWTGGGFTAWLYGILRNVVMETQRRSRRTSPLTPPDERVEDDSMEGLLLDEEATAVRAAFATLSADDQEVLELRVVGGLTADEVAVVVGKRSGAVRMAQSRALARLRTALEQVAADG
jgi:RNA polymerase sigma-70 factor, ECF subfamily